MTLKIVRYIETLKTQLYDSKIVRYIETLKTQLYDSKNCEIY